MYAGRTEKPCCLCGDPETAARIDVPPRAVRLMRNAGPIAWRDIVAPPTVGFCADDWTTVRDLALEMGMHPLGRCNAARASFSIREDHEAMTNATRDPDQAAIEARLLDAADETLAAYGDDPMVEDRDAVEATVVRRALEELGVADPAARGPPA
ncbi:MAG: hypothetical protein ABEH40_01465 [Haloferacaceae archaeon]